jgi:hypothetical protein
VLNIPASDQAEGVIIAILVVALILMWSVRRFQRRRPGLLIGGAFAVALGLRLLAVVAIDATGLGSSLRGGDEVTFLDWAKALAATPLGHGYLPHGIYQLQTVLFALQIKLGFMDVTAIRVTQIGIALLGTMFMCAAVYDLAGARAARLAAWCLAFEPASMFFNSEIHKESLLELSAGLIAFGGVWMWKRLDVRGILICSLGCLIAIETRSYEGWFLACGVALMILHASLRHMRHTQRGLPFIYAIVIAAMVLAPTLYASTGGSNLSRLQASDAANASGVSESGAGAANQANLALEQVDVSTRTGVITSLPTKIRELLLEPYPWQLHDASQMFGALGTLVAYAVMILLIRYAWLSRGSIFGRAGPLLYPLLLSLLAYSVTVGNAGTGFRYRSHLVTLGICALAVLRANVLEKRTGMAASASKQQHSSQPVVHPVTALSFS